MSIKSVLILRGNVFICLWKTSKQQMDMCEKTNKNNYFKKIQTSYMNTSTSFPHSIRLGALKIDTVCFIF